MFLHFEFWFGCHIRYVVGYKTMIKFSYICDQSKTKKVRCACVGLNCRECHHTCDPGFAKNASTVDFAEKICEMFQSPSGVDVYLIEKENNK